MATLGKMPRPEARRFKRGRKVFLVPALILSGNLPEEAQQLVDRYWSEVRDHVHNLERSLGSVRHVFHEALYSAGEEGMKLLETINPKGSVFVQAMCRSTAALQATEERALLEEAGDWQRCMAVGLVSEKVRGIAVQGYQEALKRRYEHMASRLDEVLEENQASILLVREDHRIQFPADIQVFYVAPPSMDAIKRWLDQWVREVAQRAAETQGEGREEEVE